MAVVGSVEKRIASGTDDIEQLRSGKMTLTSSDLELVDDGGTTGAGQTVGLRFTGIDIPPGAIITGAYVQFQVDEVGTAATSLAIRGEAADDAAAYTSAANNASGRATTSASVAWVPAAWTTVGLAGLSQRTPDLTAVVQEIVGRAGWSAGNDLALLITGSGKRTAESFEGGAALAPLLHIDFMLPDGSNAPPALDLDPLSAGSGYAGTFTENASIAAVSGSETLITDADDTNMERATVTLANGQAGDQLVVTTAGLPAGISVAASSTATNVVLIGSASSADYQTALLQVAFNNASNTPSPTTRLVNVTVNDGAANSNMAVTTIAIDRAPDAVGDSAATPQSTPVITGDVLANDDPGDGPATIVGFDAVSAAGGTVVSNGNGTFNYTPAAGFIGADSFGYTIADADGDTSSASVAIGVTSGATRTFEKRVAAGADDVEQRQSGSVSLTSSDLELVDDGATTGAGQTVGLRFTGIDIPAGAIITGAYVQFQVDEVSTGATSLAIRGEAADDAAAYTSAANNVSGRATTSASVAWVPAAWTSVGQAGLDQRTPDLAALVQEIVDRGGWASGNDLAFAITGTGKRTAESFEGGAAPLLHIEWEPGAPDTEAPTIDVIAPAEGTTVSGTITLQATAADNVGVQSVQFRLDSTNIGAADTSAPYTFAYDTTLEGNGTVALSAVATDLAGNQMVSGPITVTIDNGTGPPPPPPPPIGTIRVPSDYATIQEAVSAAGNGDTILVAPGTYAGGIVIAGKSITLASDFRTSGDPADVNQTIISGNNAITVDASSPNTVIQGFHFISGSKPVQFFAPGGQALDNFFDNTGADAISFENVGGTARGNHIFNSSDDGIDVDAASSDIIIENNFIEGSGDDGIEIRNQNYSGPNVTHIVRNNTIVGSGEDGVEIIDYSALSNRSFLIEGNLIRTSAAVGLGLMDNGETIEDFRAASVPERILVFNNTFDANNYGITGGDNLIAVNNIISNSTTLGLKNIDAGSTVAHTLFFGNALDHVGSNIDAATAIFADPLYTGTFGLQPGSPAIDQGAATFVHNGETVLDIPPSEFTGLAPDLGWAELL